MPQISTTRFLDLWWESRLADHEEHPDRYMHPREILHDPPTYQADLECFGYDLEREGIHVRQGDPYS